MPIDVLSNIQEKMASNDKFVFIHKGGMGTKSICSINQLQVMTMIGLKGLVIMSLELIKIVCRYVFIVKINSSINQNLKSC